MKEDKTQTRTKHGNSRHLKIDKVAVSGIIPSILRRGKNYT
jgi:hypothetical protein